jgi:hypothetical protein
MARPMPRDEPVITATRPVRSKSDMRHTSQRESKQRPVFAAARAFYLKTDRSVDML